MTGEKEKTLQIRSNGSNASCQDMGRRFLRSRRNKGTEHGGCSAASGGGSAAAFAVLVLQDERRMTP